LFYRFTLKSMKKLGWKKKTGFYLFFETPVYLYSYTDNHRTENFHVIIGTKLLYTLFSILISDIWLQATVTKPPLFPFGLNDQLFPTLWKKSVKNFGMFYNHYIYPHPQKRCGRMLWRDSENFGSSRNCLGSIDGKYVKLKCPASSGSNYFCYKNYCSIVLLAIVDPYYKFIVVDIGSYGRHNDSGIFKNSALYREYTDGKNFLPPKPLPGTNIPVPHALTLRSLN